ncbi:MAG: 2-hydroxyacyl-CoA dehydratase family protein [Fusobacteriaceae bacterium]|jgi:benzoyl-CoA reductase/2-hydroxyglutaryl-CoA dehydratase subunit BcrC/BadD/HgdB|nr:2-hydroxyacyl-CoA dehydratase family protein [Fusobacteriaceae bacterium]
MEDNLKKYIDLFEKLAKSPKESIETHKKETGKGAVGVFPVYAPEELIDAAGYLPVGIWGGQKVISKARALFPPFACSIVQVLTEFMLEGAYDNLDAVLMSMPCDTLKCFTQKWKGKAAPIIFVHPQNKTLDAANVFLVEEYKLVKEKLEKALNVEISNEAIHKSIEVYNENRQIMRVFADVAALYPQVVDPIVRHNVFKSRWFITKKKHTEYVKGFIEELKKEKPAPWDGKKVVLTGIMTEPKALLEIFKSEKLAVVADDLAQESRQIRVDTPAGSDPLHRLAGWWYNLDGCSLSMNAEKAKGKLFEDLAKKYGADAVIVCMMKFCDPE